MQHLIKIRLSLLVLLSTISLISIGYFLYTHPILVEYFNGNANLISPPLNAIVKIDGIERNDEKIFEQDGNLFLVGQFGLEIIVKSRNDILIPEQRCGELILSKFLFEENCLHSGYLFKSEKGGYFNSELEITDSQITFFTPKFINNRFEKDSKIEITFK